MTDDGVNIPLLRKAVEWAEAEAAKPRELSEWEQNWWSLSPQVRQERLGWAEDDPEYLTAEEKAAYAKAPECGTCYCIAGYVAAVSGAEVSGWMTEGVAADLLNLDDDQAGALFEGGNTIEDVRRIAEEIAGERL